MTTAGIIILIIFGFVVGYPLGRTRGFRRGWEKGRVAALNQMRGVQKRGGR